MAKPSIRPPIAGPPLIRSLAQLGLHSPTADGPSLPGVLGTWVDWNRAVALARALDGALPSPADDAPPVTAQGLQDEHRRARQSHEDAIASLLAGLDDIRDAAELQRRHTTLQRAQLTSTGRLRGRLRDLLSRRDDAGARLAEIDAVMEQALAPREYRLLDTLALQVAEHAQALRTASPLSPAELEPGAATDTPSPSWAPALRDTLRELLLAELDIRFHPIEGLFAALGQH